MILGPHFGLKFAFFSGMSKITEIKQVGISIKDAEWFFNWLKKRAKEASPHDKASDAFSEAAIGLKVLIESSKKKNLKMSPLKMIAMIGLLSQLVVGCASLHQKVLTEVHPGDSKEQVQSTLGLPGFFHPDEKDSSVQVWQYTKKRDVCQIGFKDEKVSSTSCEENPHYVNRGLLMMGLMLKGMGEGLQNAPAPTYHATQCTTIYNSGLATTNCN